MTAKRKELHPLVRDFLAGKEGLGALLKRHRAPDARLLGAMRALRRSLDRARPAATEAALRAASRVADRPADPDLYLVFLGLWLNVAQVNARDAEAAALLGRIRELTTEATPAALRAISIMLEWAPCSAAGNHGALDGIMERALAAVGPDDPVRWRIALECLNLEAQRGRLADVRGHFDWLKGPAGRFAPAPMLAGVELDNCIETGDAEGARRHLAIVEADPRRAAHRALGLGYYREMIELISGGKRQDTPFTDYNQERGVLRSSWALLERRPEEALRWARGDAAEVSNWVTRPGFDSLALVRAELASGNGEAARRLLEAREARGGRNYIDDLHWARVERLAGSDDAAARHFAAAVRACERYGAMRLLDFELKLAVELPPGDVARLARRAAELGAASQESPANVPVAAGPAANEPRGLARLLGSSPLMQKVRELVEWLGPLDVPVLITGETGTGKELAARALHETGKRADEPFIAVNCGAIAEGLLESELFGHERGAFTGAAGAHRGIFEAAGGGTVLLDEIGEISPRLQVALLRVLEDGEVRPVGSSTPRKIRCRVLSATNAELGKRAYEGSFRQDLYWRLRRMEIRMPALRRRPEDVPELALHFLNLARRGAARAGLDPRLASRLSRRKWPGNVRELSAEMERMRLLASDKLLYTLADLPEPRPEPQSAGERAPRRASRTGEEAVEPPPSAEAAIAAGRSAMRRREKMRELFSRHRRLTRLELMRALGVSGDTATADLRALAAEGVIRKVEPTTSPRTHYFELKSR